MRRTHRLRAVINDVCEEEREEELTWGQPFDDAHGRATARARPRARARGAARRCGDEWWRGDGQACATRREIVGAAPRRQQTDVADADEAFREDVQEKAPEGLVAVGLQRARRGPG